MLKLIKYEFRKNRNILLIIAGGLLLLQLFYMFNIFTYNDTSDAAETRLVVSIVLLSVFATVCFFTVFVLAVSNYSKELNSKSSYLIFMTPNTSYGIIFSKMLSTLFLGIVMVIIYALLTIADVNLLTIAIPDSETFAEMFRYLLESLGIKVGELLLSILSGVLTFVVFFFAIVSVTYLSVTLSATFLQNSKLKSVLSTVLFLLITYVLGRVDNVLPRLYDPPQSTLEAVLGILPATAFNLAVLVICIFVSGWLLEKKVSL